MSLFMDHGLGKRLERTEGTASASCVEVRQRIAAEVGATWQELDGTYAMFDGPESPFTQTFGLGMFAPVTPDGLATIEAFFQDRGADPMHEVSPLAGIEVFALLAARGYRPMELSTVLVRPLDDQDVQVAPPEPAGLQVRECVPADMERWIATSVAGWSETPEIARVIEPTSRAASMNPRMIHFMVEQDGGAIATGSLMIHDRVALLAGACTIPSGRGRGAQSRLMAARLAEARRRGSDLAMMVANPGSTSQRNAERRGFRVAYTRTKWRLSRPA